MITASATEVDMKQSIICLFLICLLIGLSLMTSTAGERIHRGASCVSAEATSGTLISIKVSPNTIALESLGELVTVHTDISLGMVDTSSLSLNGVEVAWTKADARGNLVAKFNLAEIKAIVEPPQATLQLEGLTNNGVEFSGTDTVTVR
jgi:hypothetical protein